MRWTLQYENFQIYVLTQMVGENSTVNTFLNFVSLEYVQITCICFVFLKNKSKNKS